MFERGQPVNLWAVPGHQLRTKTVLVAFAAAVLMIVGASLPWVSAPEQFYQEVDRLARESGVHGVYAIAGAVVVLVLIGYFLISEQWQHIKLLSILILAVALGVAYIAATDLAYIRTDLLNDPALVAYFERLGTAGEWNRLVDDPELSKSISVAPGLYITLVACGILGACAGFSTYRSFLPDPVRKDA